MYQELRELTVGKPNIILFEMFRRLCLSRDIYIERYNTTTEKRKANAVYNLIIERAKRNNIFFTEALADVLENPSKYNIEGKYYDELQYVAEYLVIGKDENISNVLRDKAYKKALKILSDFLEQLYSETED